MMVAGYANSYSYLLVVPARGKFCWSVYAADQQAGRVRWGDLIAKGYSLTEGMAHCTGRQHAAQHLQHHRQVLRLSSF